VARIAADGHRVGADEPRLPVDLPQALMAHSLLALPWSVLDARARLRGREITDMSRLLQSCLRLGIRQACDTQRAPAPSVRASARNRLREHYFEILTLIGAAE
jgi:hypothetical protein